MYTVTRNSPPGNLVTTMTPTMNEWTPTLNSSKCSLRTSSSSNYPDSQDWETQHWSVAQLDLYRSPRDRIKSHGWRSGGRTNWSVNPWLENIIHWLSCRRKATSREVDHKTTQSTLNEFCQQRLHPRRSGRAKTYLLYEQANNWPRNVIPYAGTRSCPPKPKLDTAHRRFINKQRAGSRSSTAVTNRRVNQTVVQFWFYLFQ